MHPLLNIAVKAARAGGDTIVRAMDRADTLKVESKAANDFVSEVDRKSEADIIYTIKKAYPDHAILAEESGVTEGTADSDGSEVQWIIDPLDGTTNFLRGLPMFCVSIAVRVNKQLEHAVVYNPVTQDLYSASRGTGAWKNNRRVRVSGRKGLQGALIGTGVPFREDQPLEPYLDLLKDMLPETAGLRRPGSAALDLAYVASGTYDAFFETHLSPWDIAAGMLLVQEAGGMVSDYYAKNDSLKNGTIIAATPKVHLKMLDLIAPRAKALIGKA
ncbi:MAG: inositol monophosphatase [Gammaproteobacteria bacterium]|nr:inositol monophosphatase [Gammaproteobacteria bacterium]